GLSAEEQAQVDTLLHEVDGTTNFSRIGGNMAVAISLATARAAAASQGIPLYRYVAGMGPYELPAPMGNVLGGGAHAVGGTDIQEFLVTSFDDDVSRAIEANAAVHREVGAVLREHFPDIALGKGDEGAWVAPMENVAALELVVEAAGRVAKETGVDIRPGMDLAASEFYHNGKYVYKDRSLTPEEQVNFVASLIEDYGLYSVEDPLDQEDFKSWATLTAKTKALVIGDDLYVTNIGRLQKGLDLGATNAILIKPNQIGTLTDTLDTVTLAREAGLATVISHRSGETTDDAIAHLGVAFGCHAIKTGTVGGERIAKLNELVRIAGELT
ncbi:MAG: enolase C-terminal domain-like protein, partial [Candidatus Thermoplasmatota archaeon]|nr:enolase C-terminal domain-like protein [Candidatus Thermoplasmatota archaeon]